MPNAIHVGIADQSLVLLREKWHDWVFYKDIRRLIESVAHNNNKDILNPNDTQMEKEKEKDKYKVELITATLLHSDFFNHRFYKDVVQSKFVKTDG